MESCLCTCLLFLFASITIAYGGPHNLTTVTDEKGIISNLFSRENVTTTTILPPEDSTPTANRTRRPCICSEGACLCCSGNVFVNQFTTRNRFCVNILYEPDDFEFNYKLMYNNRKIYENKLSGKNPPPVCLPLRRFLPGTVCLRFNNVYMIGRNFHACLNMEGLWGESQLFSVSFDCFRIGTSGIALVKPEDGGGIPIPVTEETVDPEDLDYNDSAKTYQDLSGS